MSANTARRRRAQAKLLPKSLRVRRMKPVRRKPLPMSPAFTKKANAKGMKRRTANIDIRVAPELVAKIDAWRAQQRVPPSRSAAIVYMLDEFLKHEPDNDNR